MEHTFKKLLVCLLVLMFSTCLLTGCNDAEKQDYDDTYFNTQGLDFYLLENDTYAVGIENATELSTINISEKYCGKPVTEIIDNGFNPDGDVPHSKFNKIVLPSSIVKIGRKAFWNCLDLTTVVISTNSQLQIIDDYAFAHCGYLNKIYLPKQLEYIGEEAFYNTAITHILIPKTVTTIGKYAFGRNYKHTLCSGILCEANSALENWDNDWDVIYDKIYDDTKMKGVPYFYRSDEDISEETDVTGKFWKYENANKDIIDIWAFSEETSQWFITYRWKIMDGVYHSIS